MSDLEKIFAALHQAEVRYLVVGGVAMALHGHMRYTRDLDLALDLSKGNIRRAMEALGRLGYQPIAPVSVSDFIEAETRERMVADKNLIVFSMWSEELKATEVDLFARLPFDFNPVYARASRFEVNEIPVFAVGLADLIQMKRHADRQIDRDDLIHLQKIQEIANESQ